MRLPLGFLDELRNRTSIVQVVGRKVSWDHKRSNQGRGDMWAPCPFHQEKTASFHVDDRKGFYYCFGCHAKGDALKFVRETENVGFMEAVEILAAEAGMKVPEPDPQERERADRRVELAEVMEQAVAHYRLLLLTGAGGDAREYLRGRGLSDEALERWEIGFAPNGRGELFRELTGRGIPVDLLIEAGLCAKPEEGGDPYDRFRGRIIFPIRDTRGRAIALGGRAMDPNARAKYLNSPETPLFDKGRSLYNLKRAREAMGEDSTLIVAEGYMDVIALGEAGFGTAVAPLGTAVTADQLRLLWRHADEPVVALDGDAAGLNAAMRMIDLALPIQQGGKSLRFALMPEGQDPDDLLKARGPAGMRAALDGAVSMVELLWRRETEGGTYDTPERRAALDSKLREVVERIPDPSLKWHYSQALRERVRALFAPIRREWRDWRGGKGRARGGFRASESPLSATRASLLAGATEEVEDQVREAVILATLAMHPQLIERFEDEIERLETTGEREIVRGALLRHGFADDPADAKSAIAVAAGEALEKVASGHHVLISPPMRAPEDVEVAALTVEAELKKLGARRGVRVEVAEAEADLETLADEGLTRRLTQAVEARSRAERTGVEETNEAGEDRDELSGRLQEMIDAEVWRKRK